MESIEYAGPDVAEPEKKKKKLEIVGGSADAFDVAKNKGFGYGDQK